MSDGAARDFFKFFFGKFTYFLLFFYKFAFFLRAVKNGSWAHGPRADHGLDEPSGSLD